MLKKDLEIRTKILGPTHADLGYPLSGLGELYYKTQVPFFLFFYFFLFFWNHYIKKFH